MTFREFQSFFHTRKRAELAVRAAEIGMRLTVGAFGERYEAELVKTMRVRRDEVFAEILADPAFAPYVLGTAKEAAANLQTQLKRAEARRARAAEELRRKVESGEFVTQ